MHTRTPVQSITVVRDNKAKCLPIGVPFEFTEDEIAQIEAMNPDAISTEATINVAKLDKAVDNDL